MKKARNKEREQARKTSEQENKASEKEKEASDRCGKYFVHLIFVCY